MLITAGRLSSEGWVIWRRMLDASLALQPATRRQRLLADRIQSEFTGLTLFLVYDLSHPFSGALTVEPVPFVAALEMIRSGL